MAVRACHEVCAARQPKKCGTLAAGLATEIGRPRSKRLLVESQAEEGRSGLPPSTRGSVIEGMRDAAIMDDRINESCPACVTGEGFDAGRTRG